MSSPLYRRAGRLARARRALPGMLTAIDRAAGRLDAAASGGPLLGVRRRRALMARWELISAVVALWRMPRRVRRVGTDHLLAPLSRWGLA